MLTSKQRAKLRSMANGLDTILQIGKGGVIENSIKLAGEALTARELVKGNVLETCPQSVREVASMLAEAVQAEVVQVIGKRFVLYRENPKDKKIDIGK